MQWEGNYEHNLGPCLRDPDEGSASFWTYIDAYDLADALRLAAESDLPGHEAMYIASPDNCANRPLAEMIRRHHGDAVEIRPLDREDASGTSIQARERAARLLPLALLARLPHRGRQLKPEPRERLARGETGVQRGRAVG